MGNHIQKFSFVEVYHQLHSHKSCFTAPLTGGHKLNFRPSQNKNFEYSCLLICTIDYQLKSDYDQEIPQSHTADQPMAPCFLIIHSEFRVLPNNIIWILGKLASMSNMLLSFHFHFQIVKGAGHHVYADRAGLFNALMVQHLDDIDNKADNDLTTTDIDLAAPARSETEVEQVPITQL